MNNKGDIGKIFLENFLKQVLSEIAIKNRGLERKRIENIKKKIEVYQDKSDYFEKEINIPIPRPPEIKKNDEMVKSMFVSKENIINVEERVKIQPKQIQNTQIIKPVPINSNKQKVQLKPKIIPFMSRPVIETNPPKQIEMNESISLDNIEEQITGNNALDKILQDEGVQTLECPGPNKRVLVYKGGKINAANIQLDNDQIKKIMDYFSTKTRIPIGSGFFKAAMGNFLITAVLSEFVGTRFVIQRKPKLG